MARRGSRKALLWGAFFIAWLLAAPALADYCSMSGVGQPVASRYVIDGDTLDLVDGRRVRLIGINAPEIGRKERVSQPYAQEARQELLRLVRDAELRLLVGDEATDRYGRTLGHLFDAQGANIEAKLLRQGLGFTVAIAPNLRLVDCHLRNEQQARSQREGVWKESPVHSAAQVGAGGFHLVRGRIAKVERAGKYLWVELDGPLVLRLPRDLAGSGASAEWQGQELETRGWIINRRSPQRGHKRYMLPVDDMRLLVFE